MAPFKLYYTPVSCGAASYIAASLAGLDFDAEQINLGTKLTATGTDFRQINPKGNVPTIVLSDGTVLAENIATLSYIADQNPASNLLPSGVDKYKCYNALGFVNSEMHVSFAPLFSASSLSAEAKQAAEKKAVTKVDYYVNKILDGKKFALGDQVCIADLYAYIVFSWAALLHLDLSSVPGAAEFSARVAAQPGVKEAHEKMNASPKAC